MKIMLIHRNFPVLFSLVLSTVLVLVACTPYPSRKAGEPIPMPSPDQKNPRVLEKMKEKEQEKPREILRVVRATAYNAAENQTDSTPTICAWGDKVRPGIIAVSRDLESLGLTRGQEVLVEGFGKRIVMDRMHKRKTNQIDIFMESYYDAIQFGVQELKISWVLPENQEEQTS